MITLALCASAAGCEVEGSSQEESESVDSVASPLTVCAPADVVYGLDVSYYQGTIDWNAVAGDGWKFAITRINDGSFMDPKFEENWAGIKQAGMIRGAYQFFRPGNDIPTQAQVVIDKVGKLGPGDLPVVIDVEATDGVGPAQIESEIAEWVALVEDGTGKKPIIYTGKYFWQGNVGSSQFSDYPLWHAQYPNACLPPNDPPPACGCANIADQWTDWLIWQYTSTGAVPGIAGNVDKNVFKGNLQDLIAFANQGGYAARVDSIEAPVTVLAGETFNVTIHATNIGGAVWDGSTRIGTTEPRDRPSEFHDASWLNEGRAAAVMGAVNPGESYDFTFSMTAPAAVGAYSEHFGFVQEAVTWFADQGGPADDAIVLELQVIEGSPSGQAGSGGASNTGGGSGASGGAGGAGADGDSDDDGCSCTVGGAGSVAGGPLALVLAGLFSLRVRRRQPGR